MVYFDTNIKEVKFPKVQPGNINRITFINQTTKEEISITNVLDTSTSNRYYILSFNKDKFESGQYDYKIFSDNEILAQGICQFGDFTPLKKEYNNESKIIVYG